VPLPDIEIRPDGHGRPLVDGSWRDAVPGLPVVSITHTDGLAVAVAGLTPASGGVDLLLGVDAEYIRTRPPGFAEAAFDGQELRVIRSLPAGLQEEWMLRAWCAKEAAAKATGFGLIEGPPSARIVALDPEIDEATVRLAGHLAGAFPGLAGAPLAVSTGRHGDLVIAMMLCELAGPEPVGGAVRAAS
jgi:phosphopantetheinyl transferase